ncbi:hypothetical protein MNEG_11791, partial [Monoraphidium neglectum]
HRRRRAWRRGRRSCGRTGAAAGAPRNRPEARGSHRPQGQKPRIQWRPLPAQSAGRRQRYALKGVQGAQRAARGSRVGGALLVGAVPVPAVVLRRERRGRGEGGRTGDRRRVRVV